LQRRVRELHEATKLQRESLKAAGAARLRAA
jgi:hypothetical protein